MTFAFGGPIFAFARVCQPLRTLANTIYFNNLRMDGFASFC
jgi:hypothetical protein